MVTRDVFKVLNFENFKDITRAHISRNAFAFIRFSIVITIIILFHLKTFLLSLNLDNTEDTGDGLGHMTHKSMKNGRKYVDSGLCMM